MRILFLVTGLGGGGAENVVVNLADAMYAQGHQVKIAYLTGEVVVRPQQPEIELIYLELEGIASSYKSFAKYHLVLKQFSPDVYMHICTCQYLCTFKSYCETYKKINMYGS